MDKRIPMFKKKSADAEINEVKQNLDEEEASKKAESRKKKLIKLVILLVVILAITNPALIPFLPAATKNSLVNALSGLFGNITSISKVIAFSWIKMFQMIVMIIALMILHEVTQLVLNAIKIEKGRVSTVKNLLISVSSYLYAIIGIFWAMSIAGVDISTVFASVGVLALIIGFGAESLIADLVTGLFMIFENEYNVGDIVEIDGFRGTVSKIGIRTTSITDLGSNIKIFNNSDMRNIINLSDERSRAICDFPIPYETNIEDAESKLNKILEELSQKYDDTFSGKIEYVGVQELSESAVILRVVAEVKEMNRFKAARLLNREIKIGMEKMGIKCPFNQLVVHKAE